MDAFEDLIDFIRNGDTSKAMYRVDLDEKIRLAGEQHAELSYEDRETLCCDCDDPATYCGSCARSQFGPKESTKPGKKINPGRVAAK